MVDNTNETQIATLRVELNAYKDLITQQMQMNEKALELQAQEYDRRLALLNHEHEQLAKMQATYVTQEHMGSFEKAENIKNLDFIEWQTAIKVEISNVKGRIAGYFSALFILWIMTQLAIAYWKR